MWITKRGEYLRRCKSSMDYTSLGCCTIAFILYLNTLNSEFVYDDRRAILTNRDVSGETPWHHAFFNDYWGTSLTDTGSHGSYRPLSVLSFRLNFMLHGYTPWGFHLINNLMHCLATGLVVKVARQLFASVWGVAATGALFAAHPIHVEAVAGIVGRADLAACIFYLLTFLTYTRHILWRERGDNFQWPALVLTVLLSAMALLFKETAITALVMCALYDVIRGLCGVNDKQRVRTLGILATALVCTIYWRLMMLPRPQTAFSTADNPIAKTPSIWTRFLTFLYLPVFNFKLLVYPYVLSFDWGMEAIPRVTSIWDARNVLSFGFYATLGYVVYRSCKLLMKHNKATACRNMNAREQEETYQPSRVMQQSQQKQQQRRSRTKKKYAIPPKRKNDIINNNNNTYTAKYTVSPIEIEMKQKMSQYQQQQQQHHHNHHHHHHQPQHQHQHHLSSSICRDCKQELSCHNHTVSCRTFNNNNNIITTTTKTSSTTTTTTAYNNNSTTVNNAGQCCCNSTTTTSTNATASTACNQSSNAHHVVVVPSPSNLLSLLALRKRAVHAATHSTLQHNATPRSSRSSSRCSSSTTSSNKSSLSSASSFSSNSSSSSSLSTSSSTTSASVSSSSSALMTLSHDDSHFHLSAGVIISKRTANAYVLLMTIAFLTLSFLPATNLFFYVGFVVAERLLYLPSVGYCLLVGFGLAKILDSLKSAPNDAKGKRRTAVFVSMCLLLSVMSARTLRRNMDWSNEESLYRSAIQVNPPKALGNLGSVLSSQARYEEAHEVLLAAIKYRPNMADVHFNLGILMQNQHKFEPAVKSFQLAIHFRPTLAIAYLNLGVSLLALGRYQEASQVLQEGTRVDGTGVRDRVAHDSARISSYLQLGELYVEQGKMQRALAVYREALHTMPTNINQRDVLYRRMGEVFGRLRQWDKAEAYYRVALEIRPDQVAGHLLYGITLAQNSSRAAEAEMWFKRALQLAPNEASVHHHYAEFLTSQTRSEEAVVYHVRAAELDSKDYSLVVQAATALRLLDRKTEAEQWYRKAVKLRPNDAHAHTNLGAILHLLGYVKQAAQSYKEALRLQPGDQTTLSNLAKLGATKT